MKIGDRFGKLTVISFDGRYAICKCECGNTKSIRKTSLTIKKCPTRSCGCIQKQVAHNIGNKTIAENGRRQIERNIAYNTNFQVITQDKPPINNTSGVKGVSWNKEKEAWDAYIGIHRKRIRLGRYTNFEDAVKARKQAEEEYYQPLIEELKSNQ
jgi:hypothetical protein